MRELCSSIVSALEGWWTTIGWTSFLLVFLIPIFARGFSGGAGIAVIVCLVVVLLWWIIDAVDQLVPAWKVLVGIAMLGIGLLPRGGFLIIACWAIYWTRVRE